MRALVIVALVACGDESEGMEEPVAVRLTAGGEPVVGVRVWFQTAESRLVQESFTDATGYAASYMENGGFVTLVDPFGSRFEEPFHTQLYTIANVVRGEELVVHSSAGPSAVSRMVVKPRVHPDATSYHLLSSCNFDQIPTDEPIALIGCKPFETMIVVAESDPIDRMLGAVIREGVPVDDGSILDLTGEPYMPITEHTNRYENLPPGIVAIAAGRTLLETRTLVPVDGLGPVVNGRADYKVSTIDLGDRPVIVTTDYQISSSSIAHRVHDWGHVEPVIHDAATILLPPFDQLARIDAATHSVSWSTSADADVATTMLSCADENEVQWMWRIVSPFAANGQALPRVPDTSFQLRATDSCQLTHVEIARVTGGYSAVRARLFSQDRLHLVTGDAGRAVIYRPPLE